MLFVRPLKGSYGANLKALRERQKLSQEEVARRLGITRQGNLPARERNPDVPRPETVLRHARAIECQSWELLDGLEFMYDQLRQRTPPSSLEDAIANVDQAVEREERQVATERLAPHATRSTKRTRAR